MKRLLVIIAVLLVGGFVAIYLTKGSGDTVDPEAENRLNLTEEEKAEIRQFWAVYSEAA